MSEETKIVRTTQQIQQEYSTLLFKAGELSYKLYTLEKDLDLLNSKLRELNFEYASTDAAEKAKAAKDAADAAAAEAAKNKVPTPDAPVKTEPKLEVVNG